MRRWTVVLATLGLACGGGSQLPAPVPATSNEALTRFLDAVRAKDTERMGRLWGTTRGPAADWMADSVLQMRMTVVQRYLAFGGYRVVEGPLAVPGTTERLLFRVELQRDQCSHVQPIELVRARQGGWLVYDVHLESATRPNASCQAAPSGTRP